MDLYRYYMRYSVGVKQKAILNDQDPRNYTDLWNAFTSAKNIWMRTVATTKNNGSQSDLESVNRRYILLRRSLEKSMKITDSERRNKLEQLSDFIYRKLNQLQVLEEKSRIRFHEREIWSTQILTICIFPLFLES